MRIDNIAGKIVALGVSGGIAAYKAVELARELVKAGGEVRVVMTAAAVEFVGPITFATLTGNPVRTELFEYPASSKIPHTDLARNADVIVVAPATAKTIAKYALGYSDDLLSALLISSDCPVVMAPAMHTEMWNNEATQTNVAILQSRGVVMVGPEQGDLAAGDSGVGRLAETATIVQAIDSELADIRRLEGKKVVVSAGPTREHLDPIRFITNASSGSMGFELAQAAERSGARVTLISGPVALKAPDRIEYVKVVSAEEMAKAVFNASSDADIIIMNAAVGDWRAESVSDVKLKKADGAPKVNLTATQDILEELGRLRRPEQIIVGFAAETDDVRAETLRKLSAKSADLMIGNKVGVPDSGFEAETNRAVIVDSDGKVLELDVLPKRLLARRIIDEIALRFL